MSPISVAVSSGSQYRRIEYGGRVLLIMMRTIVACAFCLSSPGSFVSVAIIVSARPWKISPERSCAV